MIELNSNKAAPDDAAPAEDETPYHSVPESGEATGVGFGNAEDDHKPPSAARKQAAVVKNNDDMMMMTTMLWNDDNIVGDLVTDDERKYVVTALYMSIFAIFGALLRIVIAQLFGEECKNPGTVGWLAASSPLCVTATGESTREGGIVFADLPANLLGSFIMGMMQSGTALDLPERIPIPFLSPSSPFQDWDIIHLAIRTGFCGSLTTFSSWNSEMIVMIFGTGTRDLKSDVIRALFGYIIGMETALGSFVFGRRVTLWIHRYLNPESAEEMDASIERKQEGVYIDPDLPKLERRFLADLRVDFPEVEGLEYLERWRESTYDARRIGHGLLPTLKEIEESVLKEGGTYSEEAAHIARDAGWDLDALSEWVKRNPRTRPEPAPKSESLWLTLKFALVAFGVIAFLVLFGLVRINDEYNAYAVTYRTMMYAACLAPFGALLRWKLSERNGTLESATWHWLPVGTLAANVAGSVVSIAMIAAELGVASDGFWTVGTIRAIKIGLCGCLTTVSTFVLEVHKLMQYSPQQYRAYVYILLSLGISSILGMMVFGIITVSLGVE